MTITEYLLALLEELRLPASERRRILAEVEDHLLCASADLHAEGLAPEAAEREAVRRFGRPSELAWKFVSRRAAVSGARLAHMLVVLAGLVAWVAAPARTAGFGPSLGVLWFVLAQAALMAAGLTWIRAIAAQASSRSEPGGLALVRGAYVVLGTAAAGVTLALARIVLWGGVASAAQVAATVAVAALGAVCALTAQRYRRLIATHESPPGGVEADVVLATAERAAGWLRRHTPRAAVWLDLRARPWRFALAMSAGAGLLLAVGHGIAEGPPSAHHLLGGLVAGAILASVEAGAALLGFATLGRALGLRAR